VYEYTRVRVYQYPIIERFPVRGADLVNNITIRATTLHDQAFHELHSQIISGVLSPGTKLVESQIAAQLGVSRNPIREAIRRLEEHGLVNSIPNQGTYVITPTPEQLIDTLILRAQLERLAVVLIFSRRESQCLDHLDEIVRDMYELAEHPGNSIREDWGNMALLDASFHESLVEASGSEALKRAWSTAGPYDIIFLDDLAGDLSRAEQRGGLKGAADRHATLLKSLQSGDKASALQGLKAHFMAASRGHATHLDDATVQLLDW